MADDTQYGFFRDIFLTDGALHVKVHNVLDFNLKVGGLVPGAELFSKFGRNPVIDTTSDPEDIWNGGGLYTGFPTQSETLEIFSSSASDTALGTGVRTVLVTGLLDENYERMPDVTVTLNGTTPVSLGVQTYHRCSGAKTLTAGSTGSNVGTLTIRHTTTTANIFIVMPISTNESQVFAYTVPAGHTLVIPDFAVKMGRSGGTAGSANIRLKIKYDNDNVWRTVKNMEITDASGYIYDSQVPFIAFEKYDIKVTVQTVSDNSTAVTGESDGYLINNETYQL